MTGQHIATVNRCKKNGEETLGDITDEDEECYLGPEKPKRV